MRKKKKLIIGAIAMSIVGAMAVRAAVYQCLPCGLGTYSDGTLTSCSPCPDGKVCPVGTGTPFDPSRCTRMYIATYTNSISFSWINWSNTKSVNLDEGIYQFEVAGAGGGGAGSHGEGGKLKGCCSGPGGNGGAGDLQYSKILHLVGTQKLTYKVGNAGAKGGARENGSNGGSSSIEIGSYYLSADGGEGGEKGGCSYYPKNKGPTGNGLGGAGGIGGKRSDCSSNSAQSAGGQGWIKVYKYYDCR